MRLELVNTTEDQSPWWIDIFLFKDVLNTTELHKKLINGLEMSIINASLVPSASVIQFASQKVLHSQANKTLKCRSVFSELLYILHPTTNMKQAFTTFGLSKEDTQPILVVLFHSSPFNAEGVRELVNGTELEVSDLPKLCNEAEIANLYDVPEEERAISSLENSIINRVVAKAFV